MQITEQQLLLILPNAGRQAGVYQQAGFPATIKWPVAPS